MSKVEKPRKTFIASQLYLHVCDTSPEYLPISFLLSPPLSVVNTTNLPPQNSPAPCVFVQLIFLKIHNQHSEAFIPLQFTSSRYCTAYLAMDLFKIANILKLSTFCSCFCTNMMMRLESSKRHLNVNAIYNCYV